jgi:hypothetical protein
MEGGSHPSDLIIALDIGSSCVKAALFDGHAKVCSLHEPFHAWEGRLVAECDMSGDAGDALLPERAIRNPTRRRQGALQFLSATHVFSKSWHRPGHHQHASKSPRKWTEAFIFFVPLRLNVGIKTKHACILHFPTITSRQNEQVSIAKGYRRTPYASRSKPIRQRKCIATTNAQRHIHTHIHAEYTHTQRHRRTSVTHTKSRVNKTQTTGGKRQ